MIFNLFRYFSLRYLFMHPLRTFLTFFGVALGISLFLSIDLINDATKRSLEENIEAMTGKADLTITSDGMGFEEIIIPKIQSIPGVKQVIPITINTAFLNNPKNKGNKGSIVFLGVDLLKDSAVRSYNKNGGPEIIPDPLAFLNQPDSIIATKSWAAKNGLVMDDQVELLTKEGVKTFTIRGLIDDEGPAKAFEGKMAIMDIDGSRYNFGREGLYDRADIILNGKRPMVEVKSEIRKVLGGRFKVEDKKEQAESMQQLVKSIQEVSGLLGLLAFLVGFLIIVNTVNTAISQRRKDIGSLRTFGAGTDHIIILFACEFLTLALASSLFGCWLGIVFADHTIDQVSAGLNSSLLLNIHSTRIVFTTEHLIKGLLLGLLSSSTALVYPLYKALQIHPIEAIKPQTLDFTVTKKPKILIYTGLAGFFFYFMTMIVTNFSSHVEFLQAKHLQPLFLVSGLIGIVLIGPYLVLMVLSFIHNLPLPFLFKFSLGNLLKNPARTAGTSVHLSLAFSLVLMVSTINISFKKTIVNWAHKITSTPYVVNITSWGSVAGFQVQALHESLKEKLLKLPDLNPNDPSPVNAIRVIPININGVRYMIKAYDNPQDSNFYQFVDPIEGDRKVLGDKLFSQTEENILVSEPLLKSFHKKVGDIFEMETPAGVGRFKISGIIRDFASPNGVIYFDRKLYKKYWNDEMVTLFSVHHSPSISTADYIAKYGPELNEKEHLQMEFPAQIAHDVEKNLNDNMAMSDSTKWIALIIGTMGLLNSFLISLLQRFRELGCIRSIGMTKGQLLSMVLSESVTLGFTGVILSFALTLPLAYAWVNYTLTYLLGWKVDYYFEKDDIALFLIVGLVVSFVAGIFPAMRAARLKLREALEYE